MTPRSFVATWTTGTASDTTVCVAPAGGAERCWRQEEGTRFHRAFVRGLEPGTRYRYSLRSSGVQQLESPTNPGTFTTLVRPPGEHLFSFAVLSDTHIGEGCSGTAVTLPTAGSVPPCYQTVAGDRGHPYASTLARAAVAELNQGNIALAIFNGDNTSHGKYKEVEAFRRTFAELKPRMHLARGSHDRADQNPPDPRCGRDNDCFRQLLFPERGPGRIFYSFNHRGYNFVVLDSANPQDGTGELDEKQLEFLRRNLARARRAELKSFIFFHHPVTEYANTTSVPPVVFGVTPQRGGRNFLEEVGRHPEVAGVITSHTHRNYVSYSPRSGRETVFFENAPTKEYPGGYGIVRVYRGGFMRTFHRLSCEFCREWISTTRDQYFGLYPLYTLGTLSARNFTHVYGCDIPTPPPSPPFGHESAVGGDTARFLCTKSGGGGGPGDGDGPPGGGGPGDGDGNGPPGGGEPGDGDGDGNQDAGEEDDVDLAGGPNGSVAGGDVSAAGEGGGGLPFTGLALGGMVTLALALLAAGSLARRAGRR